MHEANIHETEASAPLLERIIKENDIEGVLLDLDNTILYTNEYYWLIQDSLSMDLAEMFESSIPSERFTERMSYNLHLLHGDGRNPVTIEEKYKEALELYFKDNHPTNYAQYLYFVKRYLKDFYDTCPEIIEGSVEMLSYLKEIGLCFAFNSHAQEKWTKLKAMRFAEELDMHCIPFNAIDLKCTKDQYSWEKSARFIGKDIQKTLVVGDSFVTDILPAIEAGCRNLVWINGDLEKLPQEIKDNPDIHIWVVDSVKELLNS